MKRQHLLLTAMLLSLFVFTSCSNNDDSDGSNQATNKELLISGKWYNESKSPGTYTDCEKNGYVEFKTNGSVIIESFEVGITCASLGAVTATYTLTNDVNIELTLGEEMVTAVIQSISSTELTITSDGETLVFDKTPG